MPVAIKQYYEQDLLLHADDGVWTHRPEATQVTNSWNLNDACMIIERPLTILKCGFLIKPDIHTVSLKFID